MLKDKNENILKINDSIYMSNIGVMYDGILKLSEIIENSKDTKIEKIIEDAYWKKDESPRQNVLFSYISFIKKYVKDKNQAVEYTNNLYRLYSSAKKLADSSLHGIRRNLQEVANSAGLLMGANECYIIYFDEHTQSATEIAWDCKDGKYEDGGKYSEYIGSILQGIHRNELKTNTDENSSITFDVEEIGWSSKIKIVESSSNVRVLKIEETDQKTFEKTPPKAKLSYPKNKNTYLISIKLPIEFNKKLQNGISVYFVFQIENDGHLIEKSQKHRYCYGSWRFRVRSFNTFFNTLVNGMSKNIAYILSEKFFYPHLEKHKDDCINILHISDIHYKTKNDSFWIHDFKDDKPDLLVVTGDLVQADGNANTIANRYELCKKELIKLAKHLFKYEWRDRVLIIPGNHDYASMNEVIADNAGRAFLGAKAPSITDVVNPRVKFAYYLGFVSSFRREFFNSDKYIDYDINYIDNRFDDWGISFLLLNSSSGVSAHRQNKVALSKSKISMLLNKMDNDKFNICILHHTPLFNIVYIKDRSSVFAPIQDAYLSLFYKENNGYLEDSQIKDYIIKICEGLELKTNEKIDKSDSWKEIHQKILDYDIEDALPEKILSVVAKERIIWGLFELVCIKIYDINEKPRKQESCKKFIRKFIELLDKEEANEGKKLLEKICEKHSEVIGRIAQEKTVADDDANRYSQFVESLISENKVNLFMGGHQHVPSFCISETKKSNAIKYKLKDELFYNKKIYISEAGKYLDKVLDGSNNIVFSYNLIKIKTENASCDCTIFNNLKN